MKIADAIYSEISQFCVNIAVPAFYGLAKKLKKHEKSEKKIVTVNELRFSQVLMFFCRNVTFYQFIHAQSTNVRI